MSIYYVLGALQLLSRVVSCGQYIFAVLMRKLAQVTQLGKSRARIQAGLIPKPKNASLLGCAASGVGKDSISLSSSCLQLALREKTFCAI